MTPNYPSKLYYSISEVARISGAEVAKPTTVSPITMGVMPRLRAMTAAPTTIRSALQTNRISPANKEETYKSIGDDYNEKRSNKVIFRR